MARNWRKPGGNDALAKGFEGADLLFGKDEGRRETVTLRLTDIEANPDQPRRNFDEAELRQLADSLLAVGQLAPILVKPLPSDARRYILVAGERRWRAASVAGLTTISAHILPADANLEQIALIENLQRINLSPIEEAEGIQRLIDRHAYSQEQTGALLGRSRTEINTTLSLLRLAPTIRQECVTSHIALSKAVLLELARMEPEEQAAAWESAKSGGLTARDARTRRRDGEGRGGASRPTQTSILPRLPKLQAALDSGLSALAQDRPHLSDVDRNRLLAFRDRLDSYRLALDALLGPIDHP